MCEIGKKIYFEKLKYLFNYKSCKWDNYFGFFKNNFNLIPYCNKTLLLVDTHNREHVRGAEGFTETNLISFSATEYLKNYNSNQKRRDWRWRRKTQKIMSIWNYVVTAHKPTNVTHSCVGNFTAPQELNLIIAYASLSSSSSTVRVFTLVSLICSFVSGNALVSKYICWLLRDFRFHTTSYWNIWMVLI